MISLYAKALALHASGARFALASVVHAVGSTPQKPGANALFEAAGPVHGTLGGGCLEAEARKRALDALDVGGPLLFDLKLDEVDGWDDGLVCGGKVQVFVQPDIAPQAAAYRAALDAQAQGRCGVLVTVLAHPALPQGTLRWLDASERNALEGWAAQEAVWMPLQQEAAGLVRLALEDGAGEMLCYVEPVVQPPRLIIAGAGHIGKALSHLGALLEFEVTVVDDRAAFANAEHLPDARHVVCGAIAEELAAQDLGPRDYVVIVTRGHMNDAAALAACIHAQVAYLGLIGSKRKSLLIRRRLIDDGLATAEEVARVVSPMGLDIGARSVQEIALSIAAQLVAVRRRHSIAAAPLAFPA